MSKNNVATEPMQNEPQVEETETVVTVDELNSRIAEMQEMIDRYKSNIDRLSSENAEQKRQIRATMTADEQAKADREEQEAQMKTLARENSILRSAQSLQSDGFDAEEAQKIATFATDGDIPGMLSTVVAHMKAKEEQMQKEMAHRIAMNQNPASGNAGSKADLQRRIDDAMASGNVALASKLIRAQGAE